MNLAEYREKARKAFPNGSDADVTNLAWAMSYLGDTIELLENLPAVAEPLWIRDLKRIYSEMGSPALIDAKVATPPKVDPRVSVAEGKPKSGTPAQYHWG